MKKKLKSLVLLILVTSCREEMNLPQVLEKFHSKNIKKIEYNAVRKYFSEKNKKSDTVKTYGYALIEKDNKDTVFGFSFYGRRNDIIKEHVYDNGKGFEINPQLKSFEVENNTGKWFLGKPGGQFINRDLYILDSIYKTVELFNTKTSYIIKYQFEDDTIYGSTELLKIVELDKKTFVPTRITRTGKSLGHKFINEILVNDIKINEAVENSIQAQRDKLKTYTFIPPKEVKPNKILNKKHPLISLPNLFNQKEIISLQPDKLTLIDFWEVYCGPCIVSFPKVEKLKNDYSYDLQVIGIVSEEKEDAIERIQQKNITFLNLLGNKKLLKEFGVTGYPNYFLIDKKGIIVKIYFGFSEEIENDIKQLIAK